MDEGTSAFDRYEIVAVALPGAALLFTAAYTLHAFRFPDLARFGLGGLGMFAIASFVVGHVIQAVAKLIEDYYNGLTSRTFQGWIDRRLPGHAKALVLDRLTTLNGGSPPANKRSGVLCVAK